LSEQQQSTTSPWDVPQHFAEASSYQVRDELEQLIARDLLGPWDGEFEEFEPRAPGPLERYLVGRIGPKHVPRSTLDAADELPDTELATGGDAHEGALPDLLTTQNAGRLWASSMGLSFTVPGGVDALDVTASWGRYGKTETLDDEGKPRRTWAREPVSYDKEVRLDGEPSYRIPLTVPTPDEPGVHLAVEVRARADGADPTAQVVELTLVNTQAEPQSNKDTGWLFQPQLTVTALDGEAAVFLPIDDPLKDLGALPADREERHLRLLYRNELRHAVGRNVAVHAHVRSGERQAHRLETTWLPVHNVPATIAPPADQSAYLAGLELSMDALATAGPDALRTGLEPLAQGYRSWLGDQTTAIGELPEPLRPTAEAAIFTARRAAERIQSGIDLLTQPQADHHAVAVEAFRFANRAMALQRRHTMIGALRESAGLSYAEAQAEVAGQGAGAASWRPFQLAFVLLNLPALTDPAHDERTTGAGALVLPDRRREDRGVPGVGGLHVRDPAAAGRHRRRRGRAQRRGRGRGADAVHAAVADRAAVPAGGGAGVRGRGAAPGGVRRG
jgi:hypothetical protein